MTAWISPEEWDRVQEAAKEAERGGVKAVTVHVVVHPSIVYDDYLALATSGAAPAAQQEIRDFEAHLTEIGMPVQIATRAVVNRAREVAEHAPKGQKADRDDYRVMVPCGPLYRLAAAVTEMKRQEDILRGRAPYKRAAPTGDERV